MAELVEVMVGIVAAGKMVQSMDGMKIEIG